jgi:glutathione synthase/RimK-type ligase-like ATP-grasp enzyme
MSLVVILFMRRIALATSQAYPALTTDDQALLGPLAARGISGEPVIWSDQHFPWPSVDAVILRSCWDYHLRLPDFLTWLTYLEEMNVRVWNAPALLRWNADKIYLRDLEAKGIPVIPTIWPEVGAHLNVLLHDAEWDQAVVKPRVSATAHKTCLTSAADTAVAQRTLDELVPGPGALVQKFMPEIATHGEWSLIFFLGRYSHAIVKTPKPGDFRVQHDFGGEAHPAQPPEHVLQDALRIIEAVGSTPLYARVDGVESDGRLYLMELELIEPALFLRSSPPAADRFAAAIVSVL